jgi:hypothetical protein
MKVERLVVTGCCGKKQVVFKIDRPLTTVLLEALKSNGFTEHAHFTKAGMLYVDNQALIVSGPIGIDKLNVKCKLEDCDKFINDLEALLIKTG